MSYCDCDRVVRDRSSLFYWNLIHFTAHGSLLHNCRQSDGAETSSCNKSAQSAMFAFAWSLLSSYAETARRNRLHAALSDFFSDSASRHQMIVCRAAAHRLTRLTGAGFSPWGADTANGSLARVASAPFLDRDDEAIVVPTRQLYRCELAEVVAVPYESVSLSDWRLLPSCSHAAPPPNAVYFVAAAPATVADELAPRSPSPFMDYSGEGPSGDGEEEHVEELVPGEIILDSACARIGWNRSSPSEMMYACEADKFTDVVFAWTNGVLRSSRKRRRPVTKLRTVLLPSRLLYVDSSSRNGLLPVGSGREKPFSCPSSPSGGSETSSRVMSPTSSSSAQSDASTILPYSEPRPLLEQLFMGDGERSSSFACLLSTALASRLDSDGALHVLRSADATLPRRSLGRRAFLPSTKSASTSFRALNSGASASLSLLPSAFSRASRSSLRHRTSSPRAIDLPRMSIPRPLKSDQLGDSMFLPPSQTASLPRSFAAMSSALPPLPPLTVECDSSIPSVGSSSLEERLCISEEDSGAVRDGEAEAPIGDIVEEKPASGGIAEDETIFVAEIRSNHRSNGSALPHASGTANAIGNGHIPEDHSSNSINEHVKKQPPQSTSISPSITITSELGQVAEEEDGDEEGEESMPADSFRSSSARRTKTPTSSTGKVRRQETAPNYSTESKSRGGYRGPPSSASPMLEMLRGRAGNSGADRRDVPVNPQLQRLTTIELLQRRRHSHMYNVELAAANGNDGRRRSLSPVTLSHSLAAAGYGSEFLSGGSSGLFDTFRRGQSRRMHSRDRVDGEGAGGKPAMKPPTVLVYTAGNAGLYGRIHEALAGILPSSVYTIFHISPEAIRRAHWIDTSSACLILADTHELDDSAWAQLQEYYNKSGKIIFVCQNSLLSSISSCDSIKKQTSLLRLAFGERGSGSMSKDLEAFLKKTLKTLNKHGEINERYQSKDLVGGLKYSVVLSKKKDSPLLLYMESGGAHSASAVFSDATTEELLAPGGRLVGEALERVGIKVESNVLAAPLSMGYFIADEQWLKECTAIRYGVSMGAIPALFMRRRDLIADHPLPTPSADLLPIQVLSREEANSFCTFDSDRYFATLKTHELGRKVLFVPVTTTTMDVSQSLCTALPGHDGMVVIARQQVKGQGRGGNEFISPVGVAMFTFAYTLPASAALAKCPSFVQHVVAVAVTRAIHELSRQDDFPLRIKWPNDFYYNRSHKIGGLLVQASTRDDGIQFIAGVGINVSNSLPTTCLNDMLPDNAPASANFVIEEVIAGALNQFEALVNLYENKGQEVFLELYYKYWLHSREEVILGDIDKEKVIIRGLDKFGYLQARSRKYPNQLYSVSDDGNTFDMMKGMIRMKLK